MPRREGFGFTVDGANGADGHAAQTAEEELKALRGVDRQVEALWATLLHDWRLSYINPPLSYSGDLDSQRLRVPSRVKADGAGTCIDRGSLRDTVIGEGTKIDNQVQIGHNVTIGRHCLLAAQIGLAGSLTIGDNVALGAYLRGESDVLRAAFRLDRKSVV